MNNSRRKNCSKCGGVYFEDESTNEMCVAQLKTLESNRTLSGNGTQSLNSALMSNSIVMANSCKDWLRSHLGLNEFCKCKAEEIKKKNMNRIMTDFGKSKPMEMSTKEYDRKIKEGDELMRFRDTQRKIEHLLKKYK